jgi:hypothetical protein
VGRMGGTATTTRREDKGHQPEQSPATPKTRGNACAEVPWDDYRDHPLSYR